MCRFQPFSALSFARLPAQSAVWLTALAVLAILMNAPAQAQNFQTQAPHALLLDAGSGTVLFEKAADEQFAPASMAKMMTLELLFREIDQGRIRWIANS